jgi:hypothetical protein
MNLDLRKPVEEDIEFGELRLLLVSQAIDVAHARGRDIPVANDVFRAAMELLRACSPLAPMNSAALNALLLGRADEIAVRNGREARTNDVTDFYLAAISLLKLYQTNQKEKPCDVTDVTRGLPLS